ncbi:hypothetical protein J5N97_006003 [Dioscorea zingiberensis]|uniref:Uncharacterized protein n=1 Tax=Dioscorea zingiberensis TaxID=325984 RepID=A0A9D5HTL9_9LILI|nr:hypothetical protein J5N97_006003 [Dioscorea zingiberensis]
MTRPLDSDREPKRGAQQKLGGDARPRLSNAHGFRSGTVAGTIGCGKSDLANPQNNLGMRPSPRNDQDSSSLTNDRRDRVLGLDKEGSTVKVPNKQNGREENLAGSPTPLTKLNASVRAPRSNPGSISRASPNTHRVPANTDDWEQSQPTNKVNGFSRAISRKCSSSQLASPPVAQLVGQRPQKITRVARRSNLSPLASSHDEFTLTETIETASINTEGLATTRHLSSNTQIKLKTDQTTPANLLENEDSGVAENKLRDKTKKCSEIEEKSSQSMQKVASLVLPSRKSKVAAEEDIGDGVRRQGRIGRGFATTTSVMHATFDTSNIKQMRSARAGSEKIESLGACPSSFWKQIEPIFRFLSAEDITYLNQQDDLGYVSRPSTTAPGNSDGGDHLNGTSLTSCERQKQSACHIKQEEPLLEQLVRGTVTQSGISICQALLSAIIEEEEVEKFYYASGKGRRTLI